MITIKVVKGFGKEIILPFQIELEDWDKVDESNLQALFVDIVEALCKGFNERLEQQNNEGISW
jgi:hypothetical protein